MGPFGSKIKAENFKSHGVPVIKGGNLNGIYLNESDFDFLDQEKADELSASKARRLDLVITHRGTLGQVGLIPESSVYEEYIVSQSQLKLSFDTNKVDPYYIYYFLRSPIGQARLLSNVSQVGVPAIAQALTSIRNIEIPLPEDREEQSRIVDILRNIDNKLVLNHRINQTVEAMAQAIFKSWFVDFDPVKAKVAAKQENRNVLRAAMTAISGKPDAELNTLPREQFDQLAATATLFPDEMEESELGAIPSGWKARPMTDCIEVNPPRTLKKGTSANYLDMANVPTNSARAQNVVIREFASGSKFMNGDTLLARITPCLENGKTAFVDFLADGEIGWGSTEFIVLRPKNHLPTSFAYFLCRHPEFRTFAISQMTGTSGRQRVPNDCFLGYKVAEPSEAVASEFERVSGSALAQIKALDEEAKTLVAIRDTLLPKLLSGKLTGDTDTERVTPARTV